MYPQHKILLNEARIIGNEKMVQTEKQVQGSIITSNNNFISQISSDIHLPVEKFTDWQNGYS